VYLCVGVYLLPYTCMYVGMYYVFRPTYVCILICFRKLNVGYVHIYAYVRVYICMYVYICVYVCMYGLCI
jgi:hypothetical protein